MNAKIPGIDAGWKERKKGRSEDCELAKWFYQTGQRAVAVAARWRVLWHVGGPLQGQTRFSCLHTQIKKILWVAVAWLYYLCSIRSAHLQPSRFCHHFLGLFVQTWVLSHFHSCDRAMQRYSLHGDGRGKAECSRQRENINHVPVALLKVCCHSNSRVPGHAFLCTGQVHKGCLHRLLPKDDDDPSEQLLPMCHSCPLSCSSCSCSSIKSGSSP